MENSKVKMKKLPEAEYLHNCLMYNPDTGKLTWKVRPNYHFSDDGVADRRNAKYGLKEAGRVNKTSGYIYVSIDTVTYKAHRIIWKMVYGHDPEFEVDHINGNKTDNRITNLRKATKSQNQKNAAIRVDNSAGFKNVSYHKRQEKYNARLTVEGKRVHLGSFNTPEEAYRAYVDGAKSAYGTFASINPNRNIA